MRYTIIVRDTVTYAREKTVEIEADDEDAACDAAISKAENLGDWDEEQTETTPWETEIISEETDEDEEPPVTVVGEIEITPSPFMRAAVLAALESGEPT